MYINWRAQRGQAAVLIALSIVGLIAMVGLAIDSGDTYSDRRHAQGAADNAALAGALARANPPRSVTVAVMDMTSRNGYITDSEKGIRVDTFNGSNFQDCAGNAINPVDHTVPGDSADQYVEVMIHSKVQALFAPVIGITELKNCVYSIAHAKPGSYKALALGNTIAAVGCHGSRTVDATGSSNVTVLGGGIFSNSDDPEALYIHDPSNITTGSVGSVGGINAVGWNTDEVPLNTGMGQWSCPLPDEMIPKYTCDYTYTDLPPSSSDANITIAANRATFSPGVYCVTGTFENPMELWGEDVTFVLLNQGLSWSGNNTIHLIAPRPASAGTHNLLLYMPYGNTSTLKLNGTSGLDITGSVFAPDADIVLQGNFGNVAITSQWVGKTVYLAGDLVAKFQYDEARVYQYPAPPELQLTR